MQIQAHNVFIEDFKSFVRDGIFHRTKTDAFSETEARLQTLRNDGNSGNTGKPARDHVTVTYQFKPLKLHVRPSNRKIPANLVRPGD